MSRPILLDEDSIQISLKKHSDWNRNDKSIIKEVICSNFAAAIGFINSVAVFAETLDHHPDILLYGWNKIKITLSTHDKGGLTHLDFDLATKIDTIKIY